MNNVRVEVVLLAIALALLFMIPGIAFLSIPFWGWIIFGANVPIALLLPNLLMNRLLTGKFTNKGKLWFD